MEIALEITGMLLLFTVMLILPIYGAVKFQQYKGTKYYKLLLKDFGLEIAPDSSMLNEISGQYHGCFISVKNGTFGNLRNKQSVIKISVLHPNISVRHCTLVTSKKVKQKTYNDALLNFENYIVARLPKNYVLDQQIKKEILDAAITLGMEDKLDLSQEENGAFSQIHSFPMTNKRRYKRAKKMIEMLIALSTYLAKPQN